MPFKYRIALIFLIVVFTLGIGTSIRDRRQLKECHNKQQAKVIDLYTLKKRGGFMKYTYQVAGKTYRTTESLKGEIRINDLTLGDTLIIKVSCRDPNVSKAISNQ